MAAVLHHAELLPGLGASAAAAAAEHLGKLQEAGIAWQRQQQQQKVAYACSYSTGQLFDWLPQEQLEQLQQ
jgi:hypothetical protein